MIDFNSSTSQIRISPERFYALADIAQDVDRKPLEVYLDGVTGLCVDVEADVRKLARANDAILSEVHRVTQRRDNPFDRPDEGEGGPLSNLRHTTSGLNFLTLIQQVVEALLNGYKHLRNAAHRFCPGTITLTGERILAPKDGLEVQALAFQMQMNMGVLETFSSGVFTSEKAPEAIQDLGRTVVAGLDGYHNLLRERHSTQGIKIHGDPVSTDIALSIFENVDAHGEIQDGKDPDEVSAYSVHKAMLIADAVRVGLIGDFIKDPGLVVKFIQDHLQLLWVQAQALAALAEPYGDRVRKVTNRTWEKPWKMPEERFQDAVKSIGDLDPRHVLYKDKQGLQTAEERKELAFRNETLKALTWRLQDGERAEEIVQYILRRKKELRDYHLEENSFFVCKIGQGNMFTGDAPGGLSVVPGAKPTVSLEEVIGSGFSEVGAFLGQTESGAKWHDLFVATSPSKRADKNNILLVGPQGCGKTEVLRAVASDRTSIGIFAQASDFLTCWKGEAEKNPKRLFEAGLRLQRESGKQVYFLIDEVDTILNGDRGQAAFGGFNLATEFQVLMDGITTYPHLAVWGATNALHRIPMPLIRRFAKVIIVGELTQEDRVALLKQFMGYLPLKGFKNGAWEAAAKRLDGAVGDIIRKVVDHIWREQMGQFVTDRPQEAEKLVEHLSVGGKFEVSQFTAQKRKELLRRLRPFMAATPEDLSASLDLHLGNVGIQGEIQTAVETYQQARAMVDGMSAQ